MEIEKIFLISILFLGGIFYFHFCLAQTVSLTPSTQEVEKNASFSLALDVASVSSLFGVAFDLDFNPSLVSFVSADEGTFLSAGCQTSLMTNENPAGKLIVGLTRLGASCGGVSGSGTLMTLNFNSLQQDGTNNFSFSNNSLCLLDGSSCNYVTGTWQTASVTIGDSQPPDTTPPSRSNPQPTGTLSSGTTQTTISLTTDETATCKYSTTAGVSYASMANTFSSTGGNSHSTTVSGLADGQSYAYYVRCQDGFNNANSNDYTISFSIASADVGSGSSRDLTPPSISSISAASITNSSAIINWTTNEPADSQIEYGPTAAYGSQTALDSDLVASHSVTLSELSPGTVYHYRIKTKDAAGNLATSEDKTFTTEDSTEVQPPPSPSPPSPPSDSLSLTNEGKILTSADSDKIYLIVNNQRRWIANPEVFVSYGLTPNSEEIVSQSELDQYPLGPDINQPSLPEGTLVRAKGDYRVYIIKPPYKRHIFNPDIFNMYQHFNWNSIQEVEADIVSSYITSDLYRALNDYKVYSLEEVDEASGRAIKHHLNLTAEQYINKGYSWNQVFIVNQEEKDYYETGNDLVN